MSAKETSFRHFLQANCSRRMAINFERQRFADTTARDKSRIMVSLSPKDFNFYLQVFQLANYGVTFSAICLDAVKKSDNIRPLPCNHVFHQQCFDNWFWQAEWAKNCPLCRAALLE